MLHCCETEWGAGSLTKRAEEQSWSSNKRRPHHHETWRHWTHPKSRYWVEFPPGPVAIGDETIRTFAERETRMGTLRLLAPTECVMDRLAWYFHDADTQCLDQAIQVATRHPVDLKRIARWARGERPHGEARFRKFERRLSGTNR